MTFCVVPLGLFFDRFFFHGFHSSVVIDSPGDSCWLLTAHSVETLEQAEDSVERILMDSRRKIFSSSIFFLFCPAHLNLYWLSSCSDVDPCVAGNLNTESILPNSASEELNHCFESANSAFILCNSSFNDWHPVQPWVFWPFWHEELMGVLTILTRGVRIAYESAAAWLNLISADTVRRLRFTMFNWHNNYRWMVVLVTLVVV